MEKYNLTESTNAFGFPVTTFPEGINEAFAELIKKTGDRTGERSYYGISFFKDGAIVYIAAAEEKQEGEAERYNYDAYTIEKGIYISAVVYGWKDKVDKIKDVCMEVVNDRQTDTAKPCIEWYKSENELIVMVQMKQSVNLKK